MPLPSKGMLEAGAKAVEEFAPELAATLKASRLGESAAAIADKARELLSSEASEIHRSSHSAPFSLGQLLRGRETPGPEFEPVPTRFLSHDKTLSIDVLSADQLFTRVHGEKVNADLFKTKIVDGEKVRRLHYLNASDAADQTHITLSQNQRIIGVSGLQTNPRDAKQLWVQHVSVEAQHQGKGFASAMIESIYDYARRRSQLVVPSSFSKDGQRLKHIFDRLDALHPEAASNLPHRDL